jgi:hypothetical protein
MDGETDLVMADDLRPCERFAIARPELGVPRLELPFSERSSYP